IAGLVQNRLGLGPIRASMLKGACACQTEAFQVCSEVLKAGSANLVLMVTSEGLLPNILNVLDWKTSSLFGEGGSAFLLERGDEDTYVINGSDANQGASLVYHAPLRRDVVEMGEVGMNVRRFHQAGKARELAN